METNPKFLEGAFVDLMNELREIKEAIQRLDNKINELDYKVSQMKEGQ
jgi:hypothetical protein